MIEKKQRVTWWTKSTLKLSFVGLIVSSFIITFYIITIPTKTYVPEVTKRILSKDISLPLLENVSVDSHGIPKILHQMWSSEDIPGHIDPLRRSCMDKNPDYTYVLWTHDSMVTFIVRLYPWFLDVYLNYPYQIQRVDVARYFILYHFGGVYLDIDCMCKTSFKSVLSNMSVNQTVLLIETEILGVSNGFMAAKPKDKFFEMLIQQLPKFANRIYIFRHTTIIFSSGPMFVTSNWFQYDKRDTIYVLPLMHFRQTYFHEQFSGSWHGWDTELVDLFRRHYCLILCVIICALFCVIMSKKYTSKINCKHVNKMTNL